MAEESKYHRTVARSPEDGKSDVYDVLVAFDVTCPATAHAIKKLLVPGGRNGGKSKVQDLEEARWSINRAIELAQQAEGFGCGKENIDD